MLTHSRTIVLGKQGENHATEILFDCSEWLAGTDGGEIQLVAQRPSESEGYPVPVVGVEDGVVWNVSATDLAYSGTGYCEVRYVVDEVVKKSRTFTTKINSGLTPSDEPPAAYVPYINEVFRITNPPLIISPDVDVSEVQPGTQYPVKNSIAEMKDAVDTGRPLMLYGEYVVDGVTMLKMYANSYSASVTRTEVGMLYQVLFRAENWYQDPFEEDITFYHYYLAFMPELEQSYIMQVPTRGE